MYSTVHAHMDTCGFKREQVIRSDNVWLSEVMLWKRCGARVRGHPPWSVSGFQTRFLEGTGGRCYPTAIREHTQDFHKNTQDFHKNTQDFRKNYTRIATEYHKKSTRNYARITTWNPTENSRNNFRFSCENTRIRMSHW